MTEGEKVRSDVVSDDIFDIDYYVQRGGSLQSAIDAYCRHIEERPWEHDEPRLRGHFGRHLDYRCAFIWLHEDAGTQTLAHECSHAANHLAQSLCIKDLDSADEFCGHYVGWLAKQIVEKLFEHEQ